MSQLHPILPGSPASSRHQGHHWLLGSKYMTIESIHMKGDEALLGVLDTLLLEPE